MPRRNLDRVTRTLLARCRRCEPAAYEAVAHRYAANLYGALLLTLGASEQAQRVATEVFRRARAEVHLLPASADLEGWLKQLAGEACGHLNLAGSPLEGVSLTGPVAAPLETEVEALVAECAALMRQAAEERAPLLAQRLRRRRNDLVVAGGGLVIVLGVVIMTHMALRAGASSASRRGLALLRAELESQDLPNALRDLAEGPLAPADLKENEQRALKEAALVLDELANTDPKAAAVELPLLQGRMENAELTETIAEVMRRCSGEDRSHLAAAGLVLEELAGL